MSGTKLTGTISTDSLESLHRAAFLRAVQFFGQSACVLIEIHSPVTDESEPRTLESMTGPPRTELIPLYVADYSAYIHHPAPLAEGSMCPWCESKVTSGVALI